METYGLITIKSTHQAIRAEDLLKKKVAIRTIPTPRELSRSCGISILFDLEAYDQVFETMEANEVDYSKIYKYEKDGKDVNIEELYARGE